MKRRGFTLVEILVVLAIIGVVFSCLIMFFLIGFRLWDSGDIRIELQQGLRNAMEYMENDLQQAGRFSIIDVPSDGNQYSAITFSVCNGISNGRISWNSIPIHYAINSNQLLRTQGVSSIIIAENVQSLQFRRQANRPDIVEITLQVAKSSMSPALNESLNLKVKLRN